MKRLTRAMIALAASLVAAVIALPAAANAMPANEWGPYYSANDLARAKGTIDIKWNDHQTSNFIKVRGKLYDDDERYYKHGGLCAYVKFQVSNLYSHSFYTVKTVKHCGYNKYKHFEFAKKHVSGVRFKVCQYSPFTKKVSYCGDWNHIFATENE